MANFGKKAKLDCQKSTVKVECVVSVYDTTYDEETGKPTHYKVIVQRLQDQVSIEDAEKGNADALPFITNKKQWYYDAEGNGHAVYSHYDYTTWFVDRQGDLRCDDIHHDGTNHYLYRVWRDDVTESQKDRLKARIYDGIATRSDITRVTRRLGDEIGKVYGWTFPTRQPAYER